MCYFLLQNNKNVQNSNVRLFIQLEYIYIKVSVTQLCSTLCDCHGLACQDPLFVEFFKKEYWSGLTGPSPDIYIHTEIYRHPYSIWKLMSVSDEILRPIFYFLIFKWTTDGKTSFPYRFKRIPLLKLNFLIDPRICCWNLFCTNNTYINLPIWSYVITLNIQYILICGRKNLFKLFSLYFLKNVLVILMNFFLQMNFRIR